MDWIKVTPETMPPDYSYCFITIELGYKGEKVQKETDIALYAPDGGYLDSHWDTLNDWNEGQEHIKVTHWMPANFPEPAEEIDQRLCDCMMDDPIRPIAMAYCFASQAVHLRDRLKMYEDTGLEPEEITTEPYGCVFYCNRKCNLDSDFCAEGPGCPSEIDAGTAKHLLDLVQAERDGRLVVLPYNIETLLAERDAAVEDLSKRPHKSTCVYGEHCDYISVVTGSPDCFSCGEWKWRGPQAKKEG